MSSSSDSELSSSQLNRLFELPVLPIAILYLCNTSCFAQNLSSLFLKVFMLLALATELGMLFHIFEAVISEI